MMEHIKHILLPITFVFLTACGGGGGGGTPTDPPPTADAGPDQTVDEGTFLSLAGSGSDTEGPVTYSWSQTSGTAVILSDPTIADPDFTAPLLPSDETLVFTLTVTDNGGHSTTDSVAITVIDLDNTDPTVDAGPAQTVDEGDTVNLAGSGNDAEGAVTLSWSQIAGTTVALSDTTIGNPSFTAPMVTADEVLTFRLTVTDSAGASVFADVSITVTDTSPPPPTPTSLSYLFYSNSLNAVDPASPATPTLIEPTANLVQKNGGFSATAEMIRTGTVDAVTRVVTDEHNYAVIYPSTDGKIYQVSALQSGSLTPVQVSNEGQADLICTDAIGGTAVRSDFANVDNSMYLYVLPGADTVCGTGDDVWKAVRLSMSATDTPLMAKEMVSGLIDPSTAAISGWLVHDAGELQKCDANFTGCTTVTPVTTSVEWRSQATLENMLLEIDNQLYIYFETTNTLSPSRFTIPAGTYISVAESDGTTVYFGHGNVLYQMPADGSANATVLRTETSDIQRVTVGTNNVVYQIGSGGAGSEIKSVPKSGGSPIILATAAAASGDDIFIIYTKGTKVYYNVRNITVSPTYSITPVVAGVVNEDGTGSVETTDASWSGGTFKTTYDADETVNLEALLDKTFLLEGFNLAGTSGGFAGTTVKVVDAATATIGATIGTLPTTDNLTNFQCYGFGDDVLCSALVVIDPPPALPASPYQNDIYFVNAATAGSLTRVTNTTNETEVILF